MRLVSLRISLNMDNARLSRIALQLLFYCRRQRFKRPGYTTFTARAFALGAEPVISDQSKLKLNPFEAFGQDVSAYPIKDIRLCTFKKVSYKEIGHIRLAETK